MAEQDLSHRVLPAGSHPKGVLRWGYFLVLNAIAIVLAVAIFAAILYADALDPYLSGTYEWLLSHPGATSAMAFSPLACSLLVGWGYAQRARRRRAVAAAQAARVKVDEAVSHG
jgi:H+/Cl- antiporter ClcA